MSAVQEAPAVSAFQQQQPGMKTGLVPVHYNVSIGYLRAFVTVLVLAHHAVLGYVAFAPPPPASLVDQPRFWPAFPVVDTQRWSGFSSFVGFNDTFFMSLMFFISGLFVWNSLQRKGAAQFLRDRLLRLGLPFAIAASVIAPLAYYPTYLQTGGRGLAGFWHQWISLGSWPAGPAWFVWLLLAFDCIAAALFKIMPGWATALGRLLGKIAQRPVIFLGLVVAISALVYIPMELVFNAFRWSSFGPFFFQTSRLFHYLFYFLLAVGVGACGMERGMLSSDSKLARRWPLWAGAALVIFYALSMVAIIALTTQTSQHLWEIIASFGFALTCATSSFAFLAMFLRLVRTESRMGNSLRSSAYGMYLVHYAFVSWLQYALLRAQFPAQIKGSAVFLGALTLSWMTIAAIKQIPAVARVI